MKYCRAAFCAALFLALGAFTALAQDVTLTSRDGSVEINGTLLGFDGEFYRVETIYGELTVDGSGVLCEGPGCPNLTAFVAELRMSGADTMGSVLMPALVEAFALRNGLSATRQAGEGARFTYLLRNRETGELMGRFHIHATNTDEGFADLLVNDADIVMSLREIRDAEAERAQEAGMGNLRGPRRARVLALDALVPIVSQDNPVADITTTDLAHAFSGQIDNWRDLGGPDAPITLHLRDGRSGLGQAVVDRLLNPARAELAPGVERHDSNDALARAVADDPFGLGLASAASLGLTKQLALSGACGFTLRAERRNVKTEDYPLTAPLFLYLPARRLPKLAREFLTYLRGPQAQLVIRRAGFVDQTPEEIPVDAQGNRFANAISQAGEEIGLEELQRMVSVLSPMRRLTTTFRFEQGSTRLDAQSRSNVEQLARALEAGTYDTRELLFVGFSDGEGSARINREISVRRAEAVRRAVQIAAETANLSRIGLEVDAFGEAMPMACDDSAWGRLVNRRVEVWVR
ncbi:phosphate ABC transporter substrate-binding/OmpA family protein [Lutimaribacter sp. EGI FJ00015]|uniref:Phosphate ABC transporter substrate-binding/OmpA family protein n=1 Tax=Lutimaribacter degradans TaxID=2945989 RepID=A0ACC5ZUR9_9RHOB|nr:phosphate ABC transporter substrate-binding/OmpA family protein [Lutimaribacter sp. EGI FJ00013]MCM2561925.1 phosphate ABC transporter substrate-binding/OmpA family protein [Lutimaribacter sp. EGI FJ00013]MCO0613043.1 phosphate ABC transporter substrate-binding/OmpA family protein [Lutimaribacter sp. EGI FJ00015]MCO0635757.1 phosphate ABC transporter substrate-binding/OmpA family protein [Lutimaribacter sp. EGI FJ00014]